MKWRASLACAGALVVAGCAGHAPPSRAGRVPVSDLPVKIGRPYKVAGRTYVPSDERDYDEVGLASWYGAGQEGITANGERQDTHAISGAHKTLPLPSYVEVTALSTGRTIAVRINDRGPFVAGRIIDLSPAAARQLGIQREGVARVRVRRVYPPESDRAALRRSRALSLRPLPPPQALVQLNDLPLQPHTPASPLPAIAAQTTLLPIATIEVPPSSANLPPAADAAKKVFVQVGAFDDRSHAAALATKLGGMSVSIDGIAHVRIGPFVSERDAEEALAKLRRQGYGEARIVRDAGLPAMPLP